MALREVYCMSKVTLGPMAIPHIGLTWPEPISPYVVLIIYHLSKEVVLLGRERRAWYGKQHTPYPY